MNTTLMNAASLRELSLQKDYLCISHITSDTQVLNIITCIESKYGSCIFAAYIQAAKMLIIQATDNQVNLSDCIDIIQTVQRGNTK